MIFKWTPSEIKWFCPTILVLIFITASLAFLLKDRNEKERLIPFQIITSLLISAEIVKDLNAYFNGTLSTWNIPLHFCSMFMIWFFMASFLGGKAGQAGRALSFVLGIVFIFVFMAEPDCILGGATDYLIWSWKYFADWHGYIFHWLVTLFIVMMIPLKIYVPRFSDFKKIFAVLIPYGIITTVLANVLKTNYVDLLYGELEFMDALRIKFGYAFYLTLMYFLGVFLVFVILAVSEIIYKLLHLKSKLVFKKEF